MNKRNKILTAASLAVSAAAVLTGALVTSSAMASGEIPSGVSVEVVSVAGPDGDAFSCHFDDVPMAASEAVGSTSLVSTGGVPGLPEGVPSMGSGTPTLVSSGTITLDATAGASTPAELTTAIATGTPMSADGTLVVVGMGQIDVGDIARLTPSEVRQGSAEECAGLQPQSVSTP